MRLNNRLEALDIREAEVIKNETLQQTVDGQFASIKDVAEALS